MSEINEQQENEVSTPGLTGTYYAEIIYWSALAGVLLGVIGVGWYLSGGDNVLPPKAFIRELWNGSSSEEIWEKAAGTEMKTGHWYLGFLNKSDGLAFSGIVLCCMAGVLGMWGALVGMIKCPEHKKRGMYKLYVILVLLMAVMLTLSAMGIISAQS